jgi:hypothetical protein
MEGDDFELETPDPLQRRPGWFSRRWGSRGRRMGPLTVMAAIALLVALAVVAKALGVATTPHAATPPTPAPPLVNYDTPTVLGGWATPNLGGVAPPPTCPTTQGPPATKYLLAPALGVAPLWVAGFDQATARPVVHFQSRLPRVYTPRGWAWQAVFATDRSASVVATISGGSLDGHGGLLFARGSSVASALMLDLRSPASQLASWGEWVTAIYVPGPGCYYLQARWPGGGWRVTFAAGR